MMVVFLATTREGGCRRDGIAVTGTGPTEAVIGRLAGGTRTTTTATGAAAEAAIEY